MLACPNIRVLFLPWASYENGRLLILSSLVSLITQHRRVFTEREAGLEGSYVTKPVVYFPVVQAVPGLTNLTNSVAQNMGQIYRPFNPYFANFSSMDDIAGYEHANGEAMLKNKTLQDYKPQIGFEIDALASSTSTSGALDLGYTLLTAKNDSIPYLLSALNAFTQNVDATSGTNGGAAGTGLRFSPTLKTFAAQGSENVDIPSFIVPSFMTFGKSRLINAF
ncbi:MAG: hypothetical protein JOS17DRAFT_172191 [Linnemannia elongata]|nr:MAG: hypothetical protein JOS17DRAFT_172191 [Linnemannia elongata]